MDKAHHNKIYGKGYYDGLRAAGMGGIDMNRRKFDELYSELTKQPRDIYDSVPIKTSHSVEQIMDDMHRRGISQNRQTVDGCLAMLVKKGLVIKDGRGYYTRLKLTETMGSDPTKNQSVAQLSTIDKINHLADTLRKCAEELEYAALDIEQELQRKDAESGQLKQLKSLLKGIAD